MLVFWLVLVCLLVVDTQAIGGDFRVETAVYLGQDEIPIDERTTLFQTGKKIVDIGRSSKEVSVFDLVTNELIVIDEATRQYARISAIEITQFLAGQRRRAGGVLRLKGILANLERQWNTDANVLTLANKQLKYAATLIPPRSPEFTPAYRVFADWSARFNALKGLPPAPRLRLNHEIAELGLVPSEVHKTIFADVPFRVRSTHQYHEGWRKQDRDRARRILLSIPRYEKMDVRAFLDRKPAAPRR